MAGLGLSIPTFCGRLLGWPGAERPKQRKTGSRNWAADSLPRIPFCPHLFQSLELLSFHTGPTLDPEGEDEAVSPSVPGPESGWGYPFISLLLVPLQWSCLLGFYPIGALGIYKGLGGLGSSQCAWCFLDLNLVLLPVRNELTTSQLLSIMWRTSSLAATLVLPLWAVAG